MARTTITPTVTSPTTPVEFLATAGDAVNGMQVPKERLAFIRVENDGASPCEVTVLPGDPQQGAFAAHPGNGLSVTVPAGESRLLGQLDAARFSHGRWIYLDLDQASGVTIGAIALPGPL